MASLRIQIMGLLLGLTAALGAADLRGLREIQAAAGAASDCWTLLQIDAYAAREGLRLRSGGSGITAIGDPLFATPHDISQVWDHDTAIRVWSSRRVYHWAEDGAPLRPATPLPYWPEALTCTTDGAWVGAADFDPAYRGEVRVPGSLRLSVIDADGQVRIDQRVGGAAVESLGPVVVAADGSAVLTGAHGGEVAGPRLPRLVLATAGQARLIPGWDRPIAVGPKGAWFIATNLRGETALQVGDRSIPLRAAISNAGVTLVLDGDGLARIADDGTRQGLTLPFGLGAEPRLIATPRWAVLASGAGAKTLPGIDLLGIPTPGGEPQAEMLGAWRWSDLAMAGAPAIVHSTWQTPCSRALNQCAAFYRWQGTGIELIDLAGDVPRIQPIASAAAAVEWVETDGEHTVATLAGSRRLVLDGAHRPLWEGTVATVMVSARDWAVASSPDGTHLALHFAHEEQRRAQVPLQIQGDWTVRIDASGRWGVANQADGAWKRFTLPRGEIVAEDPGATAMPVPTEAEVPDGRFAFSGCHVYAKADGPSRDPARRLDVRDAWRIGGSVVILNRGGEVLLTGRRDGELISIGRCRGGERFVPFEGGLGVADGDRLIAALVAGPSLNTGIDRLVAEEQPMGPWRVDRDRYVPPRSGTLIFSHERLGLWPRYLRNPDNDVLLIPLGAVVIVADANGAKLLGHPR